MRKMVRAALFVVATVVAAVAVFGSSYGQARGRPGLLPVCHLVGGHGRHWRRIAATSVAEAFDAYEGEGIMRVYACMYGRREHVLGVVPEGGHEEGPARARHVVLAGSMVAYESGEYGPPEPSDGERARVYVVVGDLKSGRVVHKVPSGVPQAPLATNDVGAGAVRAIVVKPDGAVAWISEQYSPQGSSYQVRALDTNGERLLAAGAGIVPGSLALAGGTMYWTQGEKAFSAPLA